VPDMATSASPVMLMRLSFQRHFCSQQEWQPL
jgi:hypothetical protein